MKRPRNILAEVVSNVRGEELPRVEIGRYTSRAAARRAIYGPDRHLAAKAFGSRLSRRVRTDEVVIEGRPCDFLTNIINDDADRRPTIGDLLRTQGYAVIDL